MNKLKNYTIIILIVVAGILAAFLILRPPKVVKEIRTEESKYWKSEYEKIETKLKQEVAKNTNEKTKTTKEYDEKGKLKKETTETEKTDLTKINTENTSTSTTTITTKGETKETEVIKYRSADYLAQGRYWLDGSWDGSAGVKIIENIYLGLCLNNRIIPGISITIFF